MRDLLVCYLLGELPETQRRALEAKLADDARLRDELERLRQCLSPEEMPPGADAAPPRDLIDRTVQRCVSGAFADEESQRERQRGSEVAAAIEPASGRCHFSLVDAIVAVGVVLAISMLILPALRESRDISRRTVCQDNMRQIGIAMISYAEHGDNHFPRVEPHQPAGIFTVRLAESEHLDRQQLAHLLVCPSSPLGEAMHESQVALQIPTVKQVAQGGSQLSPQVRTSMGGSYAYRVGYFDGQLYIAIRNQSDCRSPLLSDAPSREHVGDASPHHGGCGQNVLFEDGHVGYVVGYLVPAWDNHMFLNNDGEHAAGREWNDAVMLRSERPPGVRAVPVGAE